VVTADKLKPFARRGRAVWPASTVRWPGHL